MACKVILAKESYHFSIQITSRIRQGIRIQRTHTHTHSNTVDKVEQLLHNLCAKLNELESDLRMPSVLLALTLRFAAKLCSAPKYAAYL